MESKKIKGAGLFLDGYTVGGVANFLAKAKTPNSSAKKKEYLTPRNADLSALFSPRSPFMSTPGSSNSVQQQGIRKRKAEESAISSKKKVKAGKKVRIKEEQNSTEKGPETATNNIQNQGSEKGKRKNKNLMPTEKQPVKKSSGDDVPVEQETSKRPLVDTTELPKKKKKGKKRKSSENTQETSEQVQVAENSEPPKKKKKKRKKKTNAKIAVLAADTQDSKDPSDGTAGTVNVQDSKKTAKETQETSKDPTSPKAKKDLGTQGQPPRKKKNHDSNILSERESLLKNADQEEQTRKEQVKKKQEEKKKKMTITELEDANPTPGKKLRDPERDQRTVFVGNLPVSTTKKELKKMFRKFGEIESVRFRSIAQSNPNVSKRVAMMRQEIQEKKKNMNCYVVFTEEASAQAALKRNGTIVGGSHHIRVDLASNSQKFDHKLSVFVGNLPFDVEDDSVYEHFSQCGEVEGVRIIRDSKSGLGKGFGYVLFQDSASVGLAIRLNEKPFSGRNIRVKRAVKKEKVKNTSLAPGSASKGHKPFLKGKFHQETKSSGKDKFKPKDKAMGFKKKQGGKKERWRNKPGFKGGLKSRGK